MVKARDLSGAGRAAVPAQLGHRRAWRCSRGPDPASPSTPRCTREPIPPQGRGGAGSLPAACGAGRGRRHRRCTRPASATSVARREHCTATAAGGTAHLSADQTRYATLIAATLDPARAAAAGGHDRAGHRPAGERPGEPRPRPRRLGRAVPAAAEHGVGHGGADQDPVYATDKFYDALARIAGYTTMSITDAAQRVQISAHGDAYAQHEVAVAVARLGPHRRDSGGVHLHEDERRRELDHGRGCRRARRRIRLRGHARGRPRTVKISSRPGPATSAAAARWAVAAWAIGNTGQAPITSVSTSGRTLDGRRRLAPTRWRRRRRS